MIADGDFTGLAFRVLDEHEYGGYTKKASYLGKAMAACYVPTR